MSSRSSYRSAPARRWKARYHSNVLHKNRFPNAVTGVHSFKLKFMKILGNLPSTGSFGGVLQFTLADISSYGSYINIFDFYRIVGIQVKLIPNANVSQFYQAGNAPGAGVGQTMVPWFTYSIDCTDTVVPTEADELLSGNGKTVFLDAPRTIYFKPTVHSSLIDGSLSGGYGMDRPWISAQDPDVVYYGIKYFCTLAPGQVTEISTVCTYYLQFKEQAGY